MKFHLDSADWIPDRVKQRVKSLVSSLVCCPGCMHITQCCVQFKTRLNKDGELMVVSQKHRSQLQNREDAIARLEHMLREASEVPRGPSQLTVGRVKAL